MKKVNNGIFIASIFLASCTGNNAAHDSNNVDADQQTEDLTMDVHSFAKRDEAVVKHLNLDITVDFDETIISGKANWQIENKSGANTIYFDNVDLNIEKVTLGSEESETKWEIGAPVKHLGSPLQITITPETKELTIYYSTPKGAGALQWLDKVQTADKTHPFLFTQSQAILARTWIPCQDSPGIRFTYKANVKVPQGMMAVMSASNPTEKNETGEYVLEMTQPIPSYLMALCVGNIEFQSMGEHTGVYAEPSMLKKSAYEFAETEQMLVAAENLYGKYRWERYDLMVLPPSFPFGGMENPRLTFVTPTVIAGDRSLTSLIAHELAHSWSGNLVTNATWNDFWLNEGFTVYFEKRIMEALYGRSHAEMLNLLGYQDLLHTIEDLGADNKDTHLKLDMEGRNPDDGLTDVAYEKGYLLLRKIEETVGRENMDAFLKGYFNEHAFQTMTTEDFTAYLDDKLLSKDTTWAEQIQLNNWIYGPGIPDNHPQIESPRFEAVEAVLAEWKNGAAAASLRDKTNEWVFQEWLHFVRFLPQPMELAQMEDLDKAFNFTNSGNNEILCAWLEHVIKNDYPADNAVEKFLTTVGRRKFLTPLYKAFIAKEGGKEKAKAIYKKARPNYHFVSTETIDDLLGL